jgi:peptide-methionine (S)-S-oxide reductase
MRYTKLRASAALAIIAASVLVVRNARSEAVVLPDPAIDMAAAAPGSDAIAVFAGGCFWGIEAVFELVKGVRDVVSGFAGGGAKQADYGTVSTGTTGHAESVRVTYDPSKVTYGELLKVFFSVAHDPTQLNRQGPDVGPQYRSAIFHMDAEQERVAKAYVEQLAKEKAFSRPIVTEIAPLDEFFMAEAYHQDYMKHHPNQPYIIINDAPKVKRLREEFPEMYRENR